MKFYKSTAIHAVLQKRVGNVCRPTLTKFENELMGSFVLILLDFTSTEGAQRCSLLDLISPLSQLKKLLVPKQNGCRGNM